MFGDGRLPRGSTTVRARNKVAADADGALIRFNEWKAIFINQGQESVAGT